LRDKRAERTQIPPQPRLRIAPADLDILPLVSLVLRSAMNIRPPRLSSRRCAHGAGAAPEECSTRPKLRAELHPYGDQSGAVACSRGRLLPRTSRTASPARQSNTECGSSRRVTRRLVQPVISPWISDASKASTSRPSRCVRARKPHATALLSDYTAFRFDVQRCRPRGHASLAMEAPAPRPHPLEVDPLQVV
jgi:hypothetical protein